MTINLKAIRDVALVAADSDRMQFKPSTIIALLSRLEAAEKDAARYRAIAADPYFDGYEWWTRDICIIESDDASKPPTKAQVDEAIDKAMEGMK